MVVMPVVSVLTGDQIPFPAAPLPQHLAKLANSNSTALIYSDESTSHNVTYAELEKRSNALARAIAVRTRPVGANRDGDHVVAICMKPTHNTIVALLATWKAGAAFVPMEPSWEARNTHILKDAEPALIIYDDAAKSEMFVNSDIQAISFDELELESSRFSVDELKSDEQLSQLEAKSIAIVMYTSGITGVPKGVRIPHGTICNRLWWQFRIFPYSDSESVCVWKTSFTFVDSICEIWAPLLNEKTLIILSKETTRDPQKLVKVLDVNQIQRIVLVPSLLRSILMYLSLNRCERSLQQLKLWVCSGETLSKELATEFFQYFGDHNGYKLANFYGSTEVTADVTYYVMKNLRQLDTYDTIPIGKPLDNCAVYLLDEEMNLTKETESGEVWVSGSCIIPGYVGGQASDKFFDHTDFGCLYRTGDFGIFKKGVVLYAGRTDSQVKIRGHKVHLLEVEKAVTAIQGVEKAVVLCYGLKTENPEILAFVTLKPDERISAYRIETILKDSLTEYMIPQVMIIDSIPLLVSGKVDRQGLLKKYENTDINGGALAVPIKFDYTGVQQKDLQTAQVLFETVSEVLGKAVRGALSVKAGFFELGGNSLNSVLTISTLRNRGYYIEISDFLGAANLGEVLLHMSTDPKCVGDNNNKFIPEPMKEADKVEVMNMILSAFECNLKIKIFVDKEAKREKSCEREMRKNHYGQCLLRCWDALLKAQLSIVLKDARGNSVGVVINFDGRDEPKVEFAGGLVKMVDIMGFDFLNYVEGSVRDSMLPDGGKGTVLHSFIMATKPTLSPRDNVAAILALEHATIRVARDRRFLGIFATNTSPLTQQLGTDFLGYETLLDYQINQYVDSKGDRIYKEAPDDMRAIVCWKPVFDA